MGIYERIKEVCEEKGFSINRLEKELSFPRSSISKYNTSSPSIDKVQKIAEHLAVTVDYLVTGETKTDETPYYIDDEARRIAEELAQNPNLHILFDTARGVSAKDLQFIIDMVKRLKQDNE